MALLAVLLFICIVHGGRVTATTETPCSYWYSNTSLACESNMDGVASVLLVCGIYVPCDAETNVQWFGIKSEVNKTSISMPIRYEITSQFNKMSRSNNCETFNGLYRGYYQEYTIHINKTGMDNESYECQIIIENNTVSLFPFPYPLDAPQEELKCNSSQFNNCTWYTDMSFPACVVTHSNYTEPKYNLSVTETYVCTPYSDSLSISSTLTRGATSDTVVKTDSHSDRPTPRPSVSPTAKDESSKNSTVFALPMDFATSDTAIKRDSLSPTLRPSVSPTANDESNAKRSKNNTVFAILGGIGGAAVVILLIAIIILQCVYLRRRRKRINYPVWERRDENANTLHMYSPPPPSGLAQPSPYECAVVNSSTLPGYMCQNTEGGGPTTVDHVYEDAEKYLRSDSPTSCLREDGEEEDDYAAPDDDISKINSLRASVVSENLPPQKKQSRVHLNTPETDMALKVSDEGHDYAVLQRNTCDVSWLENEALDQCTAAIGPDTEKAENDQDKPPLKPVQASDREEHVYAILEVKEEQDTSSVNELKDKSQEKSTNDFAVLSEVGGVTPPQRGEVTLSQEPALEENAGGVTPPQSKDSPSDCEPGSCPGEQETDVTFDDPIYTAKNTV